MIAQFHASGILTSSQKAWDDILHNAAKYHTEAEWLAWIRKQMADREIGFLDKPYQARVGVAINEPPRPVLPRLDDPFKPNDHPFRFAQ